VKLVMKDQPGSAAGYTWATAGEVLDVADPVTASSLLRIAGFSEVPPQPQTPPLPPQPPVNPPDPASPLVAKQVAGPQRGRAGGRRR
jgi:hypothetical protein